MKAGRELDKLIAEKVMKYFDAKSVCSVTFWAQHYSTSISAAWEVVQKLCNDGYRVFILANEGESDGGDQEHGYGTCQVAVICKDGSGKVWMNAPTAPLAICLAALKVVRKK